MTSDIEAELRQRLGVNAEPALQSILDSPLALWALRMLGGPTVDKMASILQDQTDLIRTTAEAAVTMAKHGWAPSTLTPTSAMRAAVQVVGSTTEELDAVVERAWLADGSLDRLALRIGALGVADDDLRALAEQRSRLVGIAWTHHERGEYAASIPVVLAQVDGITHDATTRVGAPRGFSLFSSSKKTDTAIADDTTVAGMNVALPAVRNWFFEEAVTTSVQGTLNRNAVLHGRELAYDTRLNSTKAFVLLAAVWEWASDKLAQEAGRRREARYEAHADSEEVDENGWRMDRRGFVDARGSLRDLAFAHKSFMRTEGRLGTLDELRNDLLAKSLLPNDDEIQHTDHDPTVWWAWRRSEAGWVFAIGGRLDNGEIYYADAASPPAGSPPGDPWRTSDDGNWSGDCYW